MPSKIRGVLPAILGAIAASIVAVIVAAGILEWRAGAQRRFLDERKGRCATGDLPSCDALRGACLKRSGEGCLALADTYLGAGPRRDPREGARLLAEACEHHVAEACRRAAALYSEGRDVPADAARAEALRQRACAFGDTAACTKRP